MNWLERLERILDRHREVFKEEYDRIQQRQRDTDTGNEVNTTLLLLIQFQSPTLTMGNIRSLLGGKAEQTIRNKVSAGEFPRPTKDGVWMIQDVADYLDNSRQRAQ